MAGSVSRRNHAVGAISAYAFAAGALERVFALALASVIAALYGASADTDAYFFALIVPLTLGTIFMEAAYTAALPLLSEENPDVLATMRTIGVTAAGAFLAYVAVLLIAEPTLPLVWLSLSPLTLVLGLTGVYAAILVRDRRYFMATMRTPAAAGLAFLLVVALSRLSRSILAAAVSVTIAYTVVLIVLSFAAKGSFVSGGDARARHPPADMLRSLGAAAAAVAVGGPTVVLLERAFASTLPEGSVTLLAYARGLALSPLLLPIAIANGVFPAAVEYVRAGQRHRLVALTLSGVRVALVSSFGLAVFFAARRRDLVRLALEHGEFRSHDAAAAAQLVGIMAVSIIGLGAAAVATRILFALGRRRLVAVIGGGTLLGYAVIAPVMAAFAGSRGLAAAFALLSLVTGAVTLVYVVSALELARAVVVRQWVLAPLLLVLPFAAGITVGGILVPASSTLGGAGLDLLLCFALGFTCLSVALWTVRPAEYFLLRRIVASAARK